VTSFEERVEAFRGDPAWVRLRALAERFESLHWSYGAFPTIAPDPLLARDVRTATYPVGHTRELFARQLVRASPLPRFARTASEPTSLGAVRDATTMTAAFRDLLDLNRRFRVRHGFVTPLQGAAGMHGWLALVFSGDPGDLDDVLDAGRHDLAQVANSIHRELMRRHARTVSEAYVPTLGTRVRAVVECLSRGYGTEEIADRLHISVHTVNKHVAAAKRVLHATTSAELVARSLQWGLID